MMFEALPSGGMIHLSTAQLGETLRVYEDDGTSRGVFVVSEIRWIGCHRIEHTLRPVQETGITLRGFLDY